MQNRGGEMGGNIFGRFGAALKIIMVAVVVTLAVASFAQADTWRGTAPFCDGHCNAGETQIATSKCGDGACCWSGHKALCRNTSPTCKPKPVKTFCALFVLICDNGCSTFACGACFFF